MQKICFLLIFALCFVSSRSSKKKVNEILSQVKSLRAVRGEVRFLLGILMFKAQNLNFLFSETLYPLELSIVISEVDVRECNFKITLDEETCNGIKTAVYKWNTFHQKVSDSVIFFQTGSAKYGTYFSISLDDAKKRKCTVERVQSNCTLLESSEPVVCTDVTDLSNPPKSPSNWVLTAKTNLQNSCQLTE